MKREPVTLEEREVSLAQADRELDHAASAWLEMRAKGRVSEDLDNALTEAIQARRRAERRLTETRKRLERAA